MAVTAALSVAAVGAVAGLTGAGIGGFNVYTAGKKHVRFTNYTAESFEICSFTSTSKYVQHECIMGPDSILAVRYNRKHGTAFCVRKYNVELRQRGSLVAMFFVKDTVDGAMALGSSGHDGRHFVNLNNGPVNALPRDMTDDEIIAQRALAYFGAKLNNFVPTPPAFFFHIGAKSGCLTESPWPWWRGQVQCFNPTYGDRWCVLLKPAEEANQSDTVHFPFYFGSLAPVYIQKEKTNLLLKVGGRRNTDLEVAEHEAGDTRFQWTLVAQGDNLYTLLNNHTNKMFSFGGFGVSVFPRVGSSPDRKPSFLTTVRIEPV